MRSVFITGTDTDVGKTVVCGLLGRYLANQGYNVITQKWVQTGCQGLSCDISCHIRLMGRKKKEVKESLASLAPYRFRFASSPHLAARLEKRKIDKARIKKAFRILAKAFDFVIVETAGGALVPFNKKSLLIDIAKDLNLPVLVVVANKLGAINHTLLTIEAIKKRKMKIKGLIFNSRQKKISKIILKDNPRIIKTLTGERILGILPWRKDKSLLYQAFIPIGKKVSEAITYGAPACRQAGSEHKL